MSDRKDTFVNRAYQRFIEKKGYIPKYFNAYNCSEIKAIAPHYNNLLWDDYL